MAYTDRFLKVPIDIYSISEEEIMGKKTYSESWNKFNPMDISCYFPSFDKDNEKEFTHVELKNGSHILVKLFPADFEKLLNDHQKK